MIAQIGPLVQVGTLVRNPRLLHVAGGFLGGATAGVLLGYLGVLVGMVVPAGRDLWMPVLGGMLVLLGLVDTKLLRLTIPYPTRQTPAQWACRFGPAGATFAWGFDLGTLITTAIPYAAMIVVPVSALIGGNFWMAVLSVALFGTARAAAVTLATHFAYGHTATVCTRLEAATWPAWLVGITAIAVGVLFLAVSIGATE